MPQQTRTTSLLPPSSTELAIAKWTKWLVVATLCLTICTAGLVGTGIWAILEAQEQGATAKRAEIDAIEQNRIARLAQQDTREQLRAVVQFAGATEVPVIDPVTKKPYYNFIANFKNFGSTRTGSFTGWVSVKYFDRSVPNSMDFSRPYEKLDAGNLILAPNAQTEIVISMSGDEGKKVSHKEGVAIMWGQAEYSDIFSPEIKHQNGFCIQLNPVIRTDSSAISDEPPELMPPTLFMPTPFRPECNFSR